MKKLLISLLLLTFLLSFPQQISADTNPFCTDGESVKTALGCIPTDPQTFIQAFFKWALPLAGLAAFILIIFGAISHITSAGNPEQQQKAKEMISAAITGLLLIIFSVVILQIIGVDILKLPGLEQTDINQRRYQIIR